MGTAFTNMPKMEKSFINPVTLNAAANALAVSEVNAAMGRIVATPTAGSAGILPAVLVHALDSGKIPTGADRVVDVHCLCPWPGDCQ
ncbi:hypothetical protein GCM10020331_004010 [Ectobacillus funiculus]